ncbi:MAG: hypothetical protein RLZZ449_788, partial [Actinomycetota bacterium]
TYTSHTDVKFYIGNTQYNTITLDAENSDIRLGNTQMMINANTNIVGSLFGFAWFQTVLSNNDVAALNDYFIKAALGVNALLRMQTAQAEADRQRFEEVLNSHTNNIADLQAQLQKCQAAAASSQTGPQKPKWYIDMQGGAGVDTKMLQQCSALAIKQFGATGQPATASDMSAQPLLRSNPIYAIPYPPLVENATAKAPDYSVLNKASSATSNVATPSATSATLSLMSLRSRRKSRSRLPKMTFSDTVKRSTSRKCWCTIAMP